MSQLSGFLKLEVSKYKDIDHILKKLEDDGEVHNVYNVFKQIFDNEFKFTFQELLRIQDAKKEPLNIKRQCESNLSLFKSNLTLIVDMIIEKALKSTLSENKARYVEAQENTSFNDDTTEAVSHQISGSHLMSGSNLMSHLSASPIPQKVADKEKPKQKNKDADSRSPDRSLNLSFDTSKGSINHQNKKKLNTSAFCTTKADSPLARILQRASSPPHAKVNSSFSKDNQSPQKSSQLSSRSNRQAPNPLNQSRGSIGGSESFVNSEFNYIKGSVRFSRSPRSKETQNLSPGPGAYEEQSSIGRSQSPKIGKAPKVCWFDEVAAQNDSPGPYLYPSKHYLSK